LILSGGSNDTASRPRSPECRLAHIRSRRTRPRRSQRMGTRRFHPRFLLRALCLRWIQSLYLDDLL